jgi:hypothetical protein
MACQFPLLALLASICSPLLNCSLLMVFLPSALSGSLAFIHQCEATAGTFLDLWTRRQLWRAVFFSLLELISLRNPWAVQVVNALKGMQLFPSRWAVYPES